MIAWWYSRADRFRWTDYRLNKASLVCTPELSITGYENVKSPLPSSVVEVLCTSWLVHLMISLGIGACPHNSHLLIFYLLQTYKVQNAFAKPSLSFPWAKLVRGETAFPALRMGLVEPSQSLTSHNQQCSWRMFEMVYLISTSTLIRT